MVERPVCVSRRTRKQLDSSQFDFPPCPGALSAKPVSTFLHAAQFSCLCFLLSPSTRPPIPNLGPAPLLPTEGRRKTEFYDLIVPLEINHETTGFFAWVMQCEKMEKINCTYMRKNLSRYYPLYHWKIKEFFIQKKWNYFTFPQYFF